MNQLAFGNSYQYSDLHLDRPLQVGLKVEWGAGAGTMRYKEGELHLITFSPYSKRSKSHCSLLSSLKGHLKLNLNHLHYHWQRTLHRWAQDWSTAWFPDPCKCLHEHNWHFWWSSLALQAAWGDPYRRQGPRWDGDANCLMLLSSSFQDLREHFDSVFWLFFGWFMLLDRDQRRGWIWNLCF